LQSVIDDKDLSHAKSRRAAQQMLDGIELYMKESLTALRQIENVVFSSFAIGEALIASTTGGNMEYDSMLEESSPESDEKHIQQQQHKQKNRTKNKNFASAEIERSVIAEFNLMSHLEDIFLTLQSHDNFMTDIYWEVDTRFLDLSTVHASFPQAITMVVLYTVSQISIKFTKVVIRFFFEPKNPNHCEYPELKNLMLEGTLRILAIPSNPYVSGLDGMTPVESSQSVASVKSAKIRALSFLLNSNITAAIGSSNPVATASTIHTAAMTAVNSMTSSTATTSEATSTYTDGFRRPEDDHAGVELGKYGFQPVTKVLNVLNGGVIHGEVSIHALLSSGEGTNNPRELFANYSTMNYKRSDVMLFWVPCYVMFPSQDSPLDLKTDFTKHLMNAFALTVPTVSKRVSMSISEDFVYSSGPSVDDTDGGVSVVVGGVDKISMTKLMQDKPKSVTHIAISSSRDSSSSRQTNGDDDHAHGDDGLTSDERRAIDVVSKEVQSSMLASTEEQSSGSSFSRNRQELQVLIVEVSYEDSDNRDDDGDDDNRDDDDDDDDDDNRDDDDDNRDDEDDDDGDDDNRDDDDDDDDDSDIDFYDDIHRTL